MGLEDKVQDIDKRVDKLEGNVGELNKAINDIAVSNATRDSTLETIKNTTQQTNDKLLNLLEKSMDREDKDNRNDKKFYQKLIITLISTLSTLLLAAYGIAQIIH